MLDITNIFINVITHQWLSPENFNMYIGRYVHRYCTNLHNAADLIYLYIELLFFPGFVSFVLYSRCLLQELISPVHLDFVALRFIYWPFIFGLDICGKCVAFKGSVQRKLRWVENGVIRRV
jgi:hypothetical protein